MDPHDSGTIKLNGKEVTIKNPMDSIKQGMIMLSEDRREYGLIPVRSVRENASIANLAVPISMVDTHIRRKKKRKLRRCSRRWR